MISLVNLVRGGAHLLLPDGGAAATGICNDSEPTMILPLPSDKRVGASSGRRVWRRALCALHAALLLAGCVSSQPTPQADTTQTDTTTDVGAARQDPAASLLSAFFGLDNGLPLPAGIRLCRGASGADGMPVIFSHEINPASLQAGDFRVMSAAGAIGTVTCVTLAPALDPGELRTALLVGEFGSADNDPPVSVEVVGNVLSSDGAWNFKGASVAVTPLKPGPSLVRAEVVPEAQWKLGVAGGPWSSGSGCPAGTETKQVVRAIWAGGVTVPGGGEAGDAERALYAVTIDGVAVTPFALADLDDGDNNHLLCLDLEGAPTAVSFPSGRLVDPNGDLNPETTITVSAGP